MRGIMSRLRAPKALSRKGENGTLLVVAGSRKYHGAPAFCIMGARRFCDLLYFLPGERSPGVLHSAWNIPEAIVVDSVQKADCALHGPGLGDAKFPFSRLRGFRKKVIDGDGLRKVKKRELAGTLITPHEGEFRALFGAEGTPPNVRDFAKKYSCTILKKGPVDFVSDGKSLIKIPGGNPGMTKGGTGDVLSGLAAALLCVNEPLVAAASASMICKTAGDVLYKKYGTAYCASDLAETLPHSYAKLAGIKG